ncbi:hypothetical protein DFH28DRAFT_1124862 [Melampsora americana]|nr:hypothetical protein DFH28DRAFT_1124862 [Melampsora americana]
MIVLQTSKRSINQFKRSLTTTHSNLLNQRYYSFESGRNRKPNRSSNEPQTTNDKTTTEESSDSKPVITGHGRRQRSNSITRSSASTLKSLSTKTELILPFVPLPSDHLSHLRPKVLSLDRFFSLQRPLLEIELPLSERRSITLDSRLDPSTELDESELDYGADEGFEDELWGAVDCIILATASAFVPPPSSPKKNKRLKKLDFKTSKFLAPYGTSVLDTLDSNEAHISLDEHVQTSSRVESGLTSIRWPSVVQWEPIRKQLGAAQVTFGSDTPIEQEDVTEMMSAVRGSEPDAGQSSPKWLKLTIEHASTGPQTVITLDSQQLNRIISYSEKLVKEHFTNHPSKLKSKKGLNETDLMKSFERLGEFLIRKHTQRNPSDQMMKELKISISQMESSELIEIGEEVNDNHEGIRMDSVQRKRKRKMKVHKYKKRRKAQRSLRKRQGRD